MAKDPKNLGKYEIVGKLGKGAMGEVYKGHDPVLNRDVAIKVIADTFDGDAELIERFRREAKMAAQLNHPNIITIYDFVEEEGNIYIVMELLDGKDLKELIRADKALTVEQILGMMEQISDGLGFAHEANLVHRDLKPANIHITKKGQIKILDFGLVHESSSEMTKTGHVMGTPNYMSPEQVQGLKVDPRSDIFSLGAVFYELLTRKKPFSADSIHATMFKVVQGEREPLSKYSHLPQPLVDMVDRALDPNPDGRFADGNDMREHLRRIRAGGLTASAFADSTLTSGMEGTVMSSTIASHPSTPSSRIDRSVNRSSVGSSASGSRGGTMRRREMSGQSMGSISGIHGPRPMGLYIGGAVVAIAIGAGLYYFSGPPSANGPSVEELSQALTESQQLIMVQALEGRDYQGALEKAREVLESDPQNAEALRVQQQAEQAMAEIDTAVTDARAKLEAGNTEAAAAALSRVLTLAPNHPLGTELHGQLNQHFQGEAEKAQAEMDRSRRAAAGAERQSAFQQADQKRQAALAEFNNGEFTNAAQNFLAARDGFERARSAQTQAAAAERQQAQRRQENVAQAQQQSRAELDRIQAAYNRVRSQPSDAAMTRLPSYQRALSEEAAAKKLESGGDFAAAARGYETATAYLEAARREFEEAEAARAQAASQQRAAATAAPAPAPTPPPDPEPAPTTPVSSAQADDAAIRQTIAGYERAIETEDIDLYRRIKPNLTGNESKRLEDSFKAVDAHDVELSIESIAINGDAATVTATRSDTITVGGRSQNGNRRPATFSLARRGSGWVIVQIQ